MDDAKRPVNFCQHASFSWRRRRGAGPVRHMLGLLLLPQASLLTQIERSETLARDLLMERDTAGSDAIGAPTPAQTVAAFTSGSRAAPSMSTGHRPVAASTAAPSRRWA